MTVLLLLGTAAGCDTADEPNNDNDETRGTGGGFECVGALEIRMEMPELPPNALATLDGEIIFDECGVPTGAPSVESSGGFTTLRTEDIGFTPRATIEFTLEARTDCDTRHITVIDLEDYPTDSDETLCSTAATEILAEDIDLELLDR